MIGKPDVNPSRFTLLTLKVGDLSGLLVYLLSTAEQKSAIRRRKTRPSCYMPWGVA